MNKIGSKQITRQDRIEIENGLKNQATCTEIAESISKDGRSVSREIEKHRISIENRKYIFNNYDVKVAKEDCHRLFKYPFVCNGCPRRAKCRHIKQYVYRSMDADEMSNKLRSLSRKGLNMTEEEFKVVDEVVKNGTDKGQSLFHICSTNKTKIPCSARTIQRLVKNGDLTTKIIDLRRAVKFKPRAKYKSTKDKSILRKGREYVDFMKYLSDNPGIFIVEMDTVEGPKGTPVLLTLHFIFFHFMLAFKISSKLSKDVTKVFDDLKETLGDETFKMMFQVILTDRGVEFANPLSIEFSKTGERITRVFFCDSYASYQKGSIEENHTILRYIFPKGTNFTRYSQKQINLAMSHVNSYARKTINVVPPNTPYHLFSAFYTKTILDKIKIEEIAPDFVNLTPKLLG